MSESTLTFPEADASKLEPHLPPNPSSTTAASSPGTQDAGPSPQLPFVTLTYATSLDSALALAPGTRTALSGPQSKAMTHYLRSRHAAICVGVGTALADDPGLNCRIAPSSDADDQPLPLRQPRPIIIDPHQRWAFTSESKVLQLARAGRGLAPYILIAAAGPDPPAERRRLLEALGGKYISLGDASSPASPSPFAMDWRDILRAVRAEGLDSIMVEGGGQVISSLLGAPNAQLIDSVIITIAPTWLGAGSVFVSPARRLDGAGNPVQNS
ncbi:riboflavin biosynthesis protein Rib7 [Apiospora aurea]|uniref:2,5-diamino-6-ribosylamino-4(3H)-pyrimidinone 5'-phosphate reductase n=1 Tax=Apiospora aurea TaxID=335848 RepID=A0ABR1QHI9_9PEZI